MSIDTKSVTKLLREIAMIRASKDVDEKTKDLMIAQLKKQIAEVAGQGELPLDAVTPPAGGSKKS